ncbi:MAG: isochorismate synthase [Kofleriaceae bacterium]|nr:isochorismate synthase [Kofleriaceae bacterium]
MKAVPDIAVERASDVAHAFGVGEPVDATFDGELERARKASGWSFIAVPAPVVGAPVVVAAAGSQPVVAWSSTARSDRGGVEVIVGIGIAHELRGHGAARWREVIAGARTMHVARATRTSPRLLQTMPAADFARPRFLGGVAFVPGAADRAPWTGFGDAWFVLPRWTYVHDGTRAALVLALDAGDAQHAARWRDELASLRTALDRVVAGTQPPMTALDGGDRDAFRMQVSSITDAIARGEVAKVVAARSAVVTLADVARIPDMLAQLDERQTECVRLLVRPDGGGNAFVAATPERLVRLAGSTVSCDALAGSVARRAEVPDAETAATLLGSAKDRREHALVVDAIASALHQLGAEVSMPDAPGVRTLRQILHLHTPITAELREPRHVLELAAALHPTPAVGGTPTAMATEWISTSESPRGWYASPVGWFDLDGNGELAVAIRSGVIAGERAHLWAGAGIVAGSDPDRELAETDLKLRAMLGALGVTEAGGDR